jgi:hypothetical protein
VFEKEDNAGMIKAINTAAKLTTMANSISEKPFW